VDEPQGIYRGEFLAMMGALADIDVNVNQILEWLRGDEDEEEEEDFPDG
jgi:hypothetical protein